MNRLQSIGDFVKRFSFETDSFVSLVAALAVSCIILGALLWLLIWFLTQATLQLDAPTAIRPIILT